MMLMKQKDELEIMNFCSHCGGKVIQAIPADDDRQRYICPSCGRIHYENPKVVVGCIPEWENRILMCRRNIEPQKGKWTLPAGYLENGESVSEGALRETLEETGIMVANLSPYLLIDITRISQIYLMFRSQIQSPDFKPTAESSEVALMRQNEIPWDEIAFSAIEKTLHYYFKDRPTGHFPFRNERLER